MLFQLCNEDINNAITSQNKLFADDSVLYKNIRNQDDQANHKNYLDTISSRAEKWLMELNINKFPSSLLQSNVIIVFMAIIYLARRLSGIQTMITLG